MIYEIFGLATKKRISEWWNQYQSESIEVYWKVDETNLQDSELI